MENNDKLLAGINCSDQYHVIGHVSNKPESCMIVDPVMNSGYKTKEYIVGKPTVLPRRKNWGLNLWVYRDGERIESNILIPDETLITVPDKRPIQSLDSYKSGLLNVLRILRRDLTYSNRDAALSALMPLFEYEYVDHERLILVLNCLKLPWSYDSKGEAKKILGYILEEIQ